MKHKQIYERIMENVKRCLEEKKELHLTWVKDCPVVEMSK